MELGELVFDAVRKLMMAATSSKLKAQVSDFLKRRRIENSIETAILTVVEPLAHFLKIERITPEQRVLLVLAAQRELEPFVREPRRLFAGSLDGDIMYRQIRESAPVPPEVTDEKLESVYELLVPRMGMVLCKLLPILDEWGVEALQEKFRRLEEIADLLRVVLGKLDADISHTLRETDSLLTRVRRGAAQRATLRMDLTALRSDAVIHCNFESLFVHPTINRMDERSTVAIEDGSDAPSAFLGRSQRSVLQGAPGAGKSTWLAWLERFGNEGGWGGLMVRVELRRLLRNDAFASYLSIIKEASGPHLADELSNEVVIRWRNAGNVAFLLDGFDEIPAGQRDAIQAWIRELADAVGVCPVVLTTRPLTTNHITQFESGGWAVWGIAPFDMPRIVDYITRWYSYADLPNGVERNVDAEALAEAWAKDPTIEPLTSNPLLLATLLLVHVLDGELPTGRAKLYQRYVDGMLGLWDARQKRVLPKISLGPAQKRALLRDIALHMFLSKSDQIDEQAAIELLERPLEQMGLEKLAIESLDVLRERTGLLVGPGVYSFSHKSVAEFLVAEAIANGVERDSRGEKFDRMRMFRECGDDHWTVVCFLWSGLAPTVEFEQFIRDLAKKGRGSGWPLVFGLLDDQLERSTADLWEWCVSRFASVNVKVRPLENHRYSAPALGADIPAPGIAIRSLRRVAAMCRILERAEESGRLAFLLGNDEFDKSNAALQWHIATHPVYGDRWLEAMSAPANWPDGEMWTYVAAAWSFDHLLRSDNESMEARLSAMNGRWPGIRDVLGLIAFLDIRRNTKNAAAAIRFLAHVDVSKIDDVWIARSRGYLGGHRIKLGRDHFSALEAAIEDVGVNEMSVAQRARENANYILGRLNLHDSSVESENSVG